MRKNLKNSLQNTLNAPMQPGKPYFLLVLFAQSPLYTMTAFFCEKKTVPPYKGHERRKVCG